MPAVFSSKRDWNSGLPSPERRAAAWVPSAPGSYEVAVAFEDLAGNVSEPAGAARVTVSGS
jgi:hypothetical protein